jgi:hypothetical protein
MGRTCSPLRCCGLVCGGRCPRRDQVNKIISGRLVTQLEQLPNLENLRYADIRGLISSLMIELAEITSLYPGSCPTAYR